MNQVLRQLSRNFPGGPWGKMRVQGQWSSCAQLHSEGTSGVGNVQGLHRRRASLPWLLLGSCSLPDGRLGKCTCRWTLLSLRGWHLDLTRAAAVGSPSLPTSGSFAFHWTLTFPHHCHTRSHIGLKFEINLHSNPDLDLSSQLDVIVQEIPGNDDFLKKNLAVILT